MGGHNIYIPRILEIKYGLIYNWYALNYGIANTGWHEPTETEVDILMNYLGGIVELGSTQEEEEETCKKLKSSDSNFWTLNIGNNSSGMDFRGTGDRSYIDGAFQLIGTQSHIMTITPTFSDFFRGYALFDNHSISRSNGRKKHGRNIRLIKDSTSLSNGETSTYTGNNGRIYPTICVGTQEWLAHDLIETKYSDGNTIPEITDNDDWIALTTGALCAYDNDWTNVYE